MSKAKKTPVDRAIATIRRPKGTDAEKVLVTTTIIQGMQGSAGWAAATDLQAAVKSWSASATAIETNAQTVTGLRNQLAAAEAKQEALRVAWTTATTHVLSTATVFCAGSANAVTALSLDVESSHARIGERAVPAGLQVGPGKLASEVAATWVRGDATRGVLLQHATDPANAATASVPMAWTKTKFTLGGQTSGANVSFRLAAIDPTSPTGQSAWSAWVGGSVK